MENSNSRLQRVLLPGDKNRVVYLEVLDAGGREEVGISDHFDFSDVTEVLSGIMDGVGSVLERIAPKKATVELGVEFAVESGSLIALIGRGGAKSNIKFTIEWQPERRAPTL